MSELAFKPIIPSEGLCVLHLFYRVDKALWQALPVARQIEAKDHLEAVIDEARKWEKFQILTFSVLARADIGFMIVGPDLQQVNALEKQIASSLGPNVLQPVYTYLSLTEKSEYTTTEAEYAEELRSKENLTPGTPAFEEKLAAWKERIKYYTQTRMYPTLPDWEYICFYPMNKKRLPGQNWYALDFAKRRELMLGHARVGRNYAGRVTQLVTGSTGLDDWEWGVTLFAHDPYDIKSIVYEMRFDEVSHGYAEFGPFYNGLTLPLPEIFTRLQL
jgi:hydrogen peroxide-dependent heme synthase